MSARGLGKVALEILQKNGIIVYGFLDADQALQGQAINYVSTLGNTTKEQCLDLTGSVVGARAKRNKRVFLGAGVTINY